MTYDTRFAFFFVLAWIVWNPTIEAQHPPKKIKCLTSCYQKTLQKTLRCGKDALGMCQLKVQAFYSNCFSKCRFSAFCSGFQKTYEKCPENCLGDGAQILSRYWNPTRKKWMVRSAQNIEKKMPIIRRSCKRVCAILHQSCFFKSLPWSTPKKQKPKDY